MAPFLPSVVFFSACFYFSFHFIIILSFARVKRTRHPGHLIFLSLGRGGRTKTRIGGRSSKLDVVTFSYIQLSKYLKCFSG